MTVQELVWELTRTCQPTDIVRVATGPFGRYEILSIYRADKDADWSKNSTCWIDIQRDMTKLASHIAEKHGDDGATRELFPIMAKANRSTNATRKKQRRRQSSKSKLRQVSGGQAKGESQSS